MRVVDNARSNILSKHLNRITHCTFLFKAPERIRAGRRCFACKCVAYHGTGEINCVQLSLFVVLYV